MRKVEKCVLIALSALATEAQAMDVYFTSSITSIRTFSNGSGFILTLANDSPSCTGGSTPKFYYVLDGYNGVTLAGVPALLSTALSARLTSRQVSIMFSDSTPNCYVNFIDLF